MSHKRMEQEIPGCPNCSATLPVSLINQNRFVECDGCSRSVRATLYSVFFEEKEEEHVSGAVAMPEEAVCFYHDEKRAEEACELCGRFVCSLCEINLESLLTCPVCLEENEDVSEEVLVNKRHLYGRTALYIAVLPLLFGCVTFITAPVSMYIAIRYWNAPESLVKSSRWPHVFAIGISGLQILVWIILGISVLSTFFGAVQ